MNQLSLEALLQDWRHLLLSWSQTGALSHAARQALLLAEEPPPLRRLVARWSAGDFADLLPVVLLPACFMPGSAGAYAISTRTIYLNADWLQSASQAQALAVLTEELGHHLGALLHAVDAPGDEGALFAALLLREGLIDERERPALRALDHRGSVQLVEREWEVEKAAALTSTPIRIFSACSANTWAKPAGGRDRSEVASQPRSDVQQIFSNEYAFAALRNDGSVVTWGNPAGGGDSSEVASQLRSGVEQVFSTRSAFAALKSDGSVVTWGYSAGGGDSSEVASQLRSGVEHIFSNEYAFAALRSDGSVITWGDSCCGGN